MLQHLKTRKNSGDLKDCIFTHVQNSLSINSGYVFMSSRSIELYQLNYSTEYTINIIILCLFASYLSMKLRLRIHSHQKAIVFGF